MSTVISNISFQSDDEPDHGKPLNAPTTPTREPVKSILKAPRVTFDKKSQPDSVVSIPNKDSIDDQDEEEIGFRPKVQNLYLE